MELRGSTAGVVGTEGAGIDVDGEATSSDPSEPGLELGEIMFAVGQDRIGEGLAVGSKRIVIVDIKVCGAAALCVRAERSQRGCWDALSWLDKDGMLLVWSLGHLPYLSSLCIK